MTQVPDDTSDRVEAAGGVTADEPSPDGADLAGASAPGGDGDLAGASAPGGGTDVVGASTSGADGEAATTGAPDGAPDGAPGMVHRPRTSLLTWGTVALVLVIVVVLVVIKITGGSSVSTPSAPAPPSAAPSAVVQGVTHIPSSVYNAVGIVSPVATVTPPAVLGGQPPLERDGKAEVVFVGNEFCPYCAAERWALVAALSRFGTFSGLDASQSGSNEAFSSTPTFTFVGTHFKSKYVSTTLVEHYGDQKNAAGTGYAVLEPIPPAVRTLMARYDRATGPGQGPLLPFVDVGNRAVVTGGDFSPSILQQLTNTQIATALDDAKDPVTQAVVATANYLSAAVCEADGQRPVSVCTSTGVSAAASALGLGS